MLHGIARLAIAAPRRIIAAALLVMVATAVFGIPVIDSLSAGGFQDPTSQSAQAQKMLSQTFGQGDMQLVISVTSDAGAQSPDARSVGTDIVRQLQSSPFVAKVDSAWTSPPSAAPALVSKDGTTGLIVAGISGTENEAQQHAKALVGQLVHDRDGVTVKAGGEAMIYVQVNSQSEKDLLLMESIAIPLSFIVLVWVFGGLLAAALPLAVGGFAILGSMAVLHAITFVTDVSIFALNLSVAMGLALAIDYTLLIISRYRDEIADGADRDEALMRTMATAGRTVLFSAMTVALSMVAMVLFPMYFLKSFAYAGVAVVAFAAVAAIIVTPAAIALLGDRLDSLDARNLGRRLLGRPEPVKKPVEQTFWYRSTKFVMHHAIPVGLVIIALLLVLGAPFLGVKWGFPDDRVLPQSASSRQIGDSLRTDFAVDAATGVVAVIPDMSGVTGDELTRYGADLSEVPDVSSVSTPDGTFVRGALAGPPSAATGVKDEPCIRDDRQHRATVQPGLGDSAGPAARRSRAGGSRRVAHRDGAGEPRQQQGHHVADTRCADRDRGDQFRAAVHAHRQRRAAAESVAAQRVVADGCVRCAGLDLPGRPPGRVGDHTTGTLVNNMPVLLFCIAFGLSMDYEVFLISRIREYWLDSGRTRADNDEAVALGLARTGRVVTAAALLMSISFAALIAAQVAFMRMFGLGLTLAVLVDATLVRMLLVPAFMRVLGRANWWAPGPLARLHARFGISEGGTTPDDKSWRSETKVTETGQRVDSRS